MTANLSRRLLLAALLAALAVVPLACGRQGGGAAGGDPDLGRLYGTGFKDNTPVMCRVGNVEITRGDFDRRFQELPDNLKARFSGEGWERRFLRYMIDETLLAQEAIRRRLDRDPQVAQALIADRRSILVNAFRDRELIKDLAPSEDQIKQYFERNHSAYVMQGTLQARHVQARDRQSAFAAYDALRQGRPFPTVVALGSVNEMSSKLAGDLGWFNKGGYIPAIPYGKQFSETVWDWPIGLHEPVQINGDWHVVEILRREQERPLTLEEARDRVISELTPLVKQQRLDEFLRQAKRDARIEYLGANRPGQGRSPVELLRAAQLAKTPEQQIDILQMILEDYPESDAVDDALFLLANVYLDAWADVPFASQVLDRLVTEHPESEYREQAQYLLENLGNPNFLRPTSLEDLRKAAEQK